MLAWAIIALVVILPGTQWGIPHATQPLLVRGWEVDGTAGISVLSELANLRGPAQSDWYVAYPLFHYLLLTVVYAPILVIMLATGQLSSPGGEFPYGFSDPVGSLAVLTAVGHGVTVVMACGVIVGVFALARRLFDQRAAHYAAAATLACAPFLFYARTSNLDVPVLFWVVLTFVAVERTISRGPTSGRMAWCGLTAALAVATKDQAFGLVVIPLVFAAWHSRGAAHRRALLWLFLSGVATFATASGLIFRPERFIKHIRYITSFESTFANVRVPTFLTVVRDSTPSGFFDLFRDFSAAVGTAVGWPALLVGVVGSVLAWKSAPAIRWLVLSSVGLFVMVIIPIHHMQYRYALAPAIVLALGIAAWVHAISTRWPRRKGIAHAVAVVAVAAAVPGGAEVSHAMWADARWEAGRWLDGQIESGDTLGFFGRPHQLPYIPGGVHLEMMGDTATAEDDLRRIVPEWIVVAPDYFADSTRERSVFLPDSLYQRLLSGTEGYTRVERFVTPPLFDRPLPYLPYVNPMVQIFRRLPRGAT